MIQANERKQYKKISLLRLYLPILLKYSAAPYAAAAIIYIVFHVFTFNLISLSFSEYVKISYVLGVQIILFYATYKISIFEIIDGRNEENFYTRKILTFKDIVLLAMASYAIGVMVVLFLLFVVVFVFSQRPLAIFDFLLVISGVSPQVIVSSALMAKCALDFTNSGDTIPINK